jgi:hypothetical protein
VTDFPFCGGERPLEGLGEFEGTSEGLSVGHNGAEEKVFDETQAFFSYHLGTGTDDNPVDLGLGRTVDNTAFAEETFADDLSQFVGKLLLASKHLFDEVILPPCNRCFYLLFLIDRTEKTAKAALHALVCEL